MEAAPGLSVEAEEEQDAVEAGRVEDVVEEEMDESGFGPKSLEILEPGKNKKVNKGQCIK